MTIKKRGIKLKQTNEEEAGYRLLMRIAGHSRPEGTPRSTSPPELTRPLVQERENSSPGLQTHRSDDSAETPQTPPVDPTATPAVAKRRLARLLRLELEDALNLLSSSEPDCNQEP